MPSAASAPAPAVRMKRNPPEGSSPPSARLTAGFASRPDRRRLCREVHRRPHRFAIRRAELATANWKSSILGRGLERARSPRRSMSASRRSRPIARASSRRCNWRLRPNCCGSYPLARPPSGRRQRCLEALLNFFHQYWPYRPPATAAAAVFKRSPALWIRLQAGDEIEQGFHIEKAAAALGRYCASGQGLWDIG